MLFFINILRVDSDIETKKTKHHTIIYLFDHAVTHKKRTVFINQFFV